MAAASSEAFLSHFMAFFWPRSGQLEGAACSSPWQGKNSSTAAHREVKPSLSPRGDRGTHPITSSPLLPPDGGTTQTPLSAPCWVLRLGIALSRSCLSYLFDQFGYWDGEDGSAEGNAGRRARRWGRESLFQVQNGEFCSASLPKSVNPLGKSSPKSSIPG